MGGDSSLEEKARPDTSRGSGGGWTRCGLTLSVLDREADALVQMGIQEYRHEHLEMPDWGESLMPLSSGQKIILHLFEKL